MHKSNQSLAVLCLLSLLGGALTGCNAKTEMSKQEEQSFKGTGTMPPGAAAAIAKQREEAQKKMGGSGGPPPESIPGANK